MMGSLLIQAKVMKVETQHHKGVCTNLKQIMQSQLMRYAHHYR
jgi:hypothetical protein